MKKIANYLIALAVAAFTFTSCEDVPSPFGTVVQPDSGDEVVIEPQGSGTKSDPYNVAGALEFISGLGADVPSDKEIYVKGFVTSIKEQFSAQYGNAQFTMSDTKEGANTFTFFRGLYLGNKKWVEGDLLLAEGDEVIICGKVVNYKGNTPETVQNAAYTYSINGKSEGGGGDTPTSDLGTKDAPITVAKALEAINKLADSGETSVEAYVKGKISKVQSYSSQYKSITYYISDDGTEANQLQIYSGKNIGGADFASQDDLTAGDVVVVKGKLKKFMKNNEVTPEMNQPNEIISITKGGDTPTPTGDGDGTKDKPYNVASAIAAGSGTGIYVKGFIVGSVSGQVLSTGAIFSADGDANSNILIAASASETDVAKCMPVQLPTGAIRNGLNLVDNKGNYKKEVTLYGNIEKYFGATGLKAVTFAILDGKEIGTNPDGGGSSGDQGEVKKVSVKDFLAAAESTADWYQLTGTIEHLEDGTYKNSTKYGNFDLVDETGKIYVYGVVTEKGGQKGQFEALMSEKGIKDGSKITIIGNRGSYNGAAQVTNAYFVKVEAGGGDTPSGSTGLEQSFEAGKGDFTIEDKSIGEGITYVWSEDTKNKYMKASAYKGGCIAAESWLISPAFSLKGISAPVMTFNNACNQVKEGNITDHIKVMVYDGSNWKEATISNMPDGKSWNFVDSTVDLKSVAGKTGVKVAFKYVSTAAFAPTWEIKNVSIK